MTKPANIILEGITGSKAYGLDHADSDEDIKGIFVAPTREFLGLGRPAETVDHVDPDYCYHELGKFMKLGLAANPTILEMLFLEGYTSQSKYGAELVYHRDKFLSNRVKNTYFGYANQQMTRLVNRADGSFKSKLRKRFEKHARHCARLLFQGRDLMQTGTLTVRVPNRDEIFAIGELSPTDLVLWFEDAKESFNNVESVLPDQPDTEWVNEFLIRVRELYLQ